MRLRDSIESTTIGKTHPTLKYLVKTKLKISNTEIKALAENNIDSTGKVAEKVVNAKDNEDEFLDSICESLSQSKIESKELQLDENLLAKKQPTQQEKMDIPPGGSIEQVNDSRLAEEDTSLETSHVFTKENDFHFDGEWLSSSVNQAGIEPICDFFSQSFELSENDGTVLAPDICDQKLSSSTKGATFGIELPGETITGIESRTSNSPQNATPNYQNYLVLNSEKNEEDQTVSYSDASFILPSISEFNLPPEPKKPFCHCREPTIDKISKRENENKDRTYYVCAANKCRVRASNH